MSVGNVYLIGAGPGDPKLITLKGADFIRKADVLVYDRLIHDNILKQARDDVERIFVGKSSVYHALPQEEITKTLIRKAKEGKNVARIKGGDPFIFGRGGEEAEGLAEAGVPFEMVPGITSGIAVPLYAGIPLTHRDYNASFAMVTGHERPEKGGSSLDWEKLADATGSLVFYMGVKNLPYIRDQLIAYGRSPQTPVALIRWGTYAKQRTLTATLENVVETVERERFKPPAIVYVGENVRLREKIQWFEKKPLFGKTIAVTRPRLEGPDSLAEKIDEQGGDALSFPMIRFSSPRDASGLNEALADLTRFDWVVFSSANAVRFFMDRLRQNKVDVRSLARSRLAAVGPKTAEALGTFGLRPDVTPDRFSAEGLLDAMKDRTRKGDKVLFPKGNLAKNVLPDGLREQGCDVTEAVTYDTLPVTEEGEALNERLVKKRIDIVTFTSASTVENFVRLLSDAATTEIQNVQTVCIGPQTAKRAQECGLHVTKTAGEYTVDGMMQALLTLQKEAKT